MFISNYPEKSILDAISFCIDSNLCSANTVRDYLEHKAEEKASELSSVYPSQIPVNDSKYHITTQKRPLAVYAKVGGQV